MSSRIKWTRCRKIEPDGHQCPMISWGTSYCAFHASLKDAKEPVVRTPAENEARLKEAMIKVKGINAVTSLGIGIPATFLDRIIGLETRPRLSLYYKADIILDVFERMPVELQTQIQEELERIAHDAPSHP